MSDDSEGEIAVHSHKDPNDQHTKEVCNVDMYMQQIEMIYNLVFH